MKKKNIDTIERKVANTILQQPKKLKIGDKEYRLSKMTFSTIIEMSASVSELPQDISETKENPIVASLRFGRFYGSAPSVLAVAMVSSMWMLLGRFGHFVYRVKVRRKTRRLSVMHTSSELNDAAQKLMADTELAHFFALTTFLAGINMTKATKVETETETPTTETTASGRS